jgi:putative NIF3 family GTP cyclohydrolase 1 type 2
VDPAAFFSLLEELAPLRLAESWDNVGLLVEPVTRRELKRVLLTIDLTEAVRKRLNSVLRRLSATTRRCFRR